MTTTYLSIERGDVCVEFEDIGEGWSGDYDATDPDDTPLLRFTVLRRTSGDDWEQIEDASYCTRIPAATPEGEVRRLAGVIMEHVYDDVTSGKSIKRTCEDLSWLQARNPTQRPNGS